MRSPATRTASPAWAWTRTRARTGGRLWTRSAGWRSGARCGWPTGSSAAWAGDPGAGEALYDVARDVVFALFRPTRVLQHVDSVAAATGPVDGRQRQRRASGAPRRLARRAVVERPVVYFADVPQAVANHLRGVGAGRRPAPADRAADRATGRGVLLVDTASFTTERFPGAGSVAQAAVLLAVEMADRALTPTAAGSGGIAPPDRAGAGPAWSASVDAGLPSATLVLLRRPPTSTTSTLASMATWPTGTSRVSCRSSPTASSGPPRPRSWNATGPPFGAQWHADPDRLRIEAVALLARFGAVTPVPGGVLVRPLVGRYRNTVAEVRQRRAQQTIF